MGALAQGKLLPSIKELIQIGTTFTLTVLAWIFFRTENIKHAFTYFSEIFSPSLLTTPNFPNRSGAATTLLLIGIFMLFEWFGRNNEYAIEKTGKKHHRAFRWFLYYCLIIVIVIYGGSQQEFIYFQF